MKGDFSPMRREDTCLPSSTARINPPEIYLWMTSIFANLPRTLHASEKLPRSTRRIGMNGNVCDCECAVTSAHPTYTKQIIKISQNPVDVYRFFPNGAARTSWHNDNSSPLMDGTSKSYAFVSFRVEASSTTVSPSALGRKAEIVPRL